MLLLEPERTPYDLEWQLGNVPVRIHPMFWLAGALTGWGAIHQGLEFVLAWIGCFFVSILIHELGHIWMGQAFGSRGYIILYAFGGLAVGSNNLVHPWKRIAVSCAGPAAGFLFLGLVLAVAALVNTDLFYGYVLYLKRVFTPLTLEDQQFLFFLSQTWEFPFTLRDQIVLDLIWINLFWGLLNLVPVWPLDGGQISADFFTWWKGGAGYRFALGLSFLVAALIAVNSVLAMNRIVLIPFLPLGSMFMVIMFGLLAVQSFQLLHQGNPPQP